MSRQVERRVLFDRWFDKLDPQHKGHEPRTDRRKLARAYAKGAWRKRAK